MRWFFLGILATSSFGCAKFRPVALTSVDMVERVKVDDATANCSWVRVAGDFRSFDTELFLCCPGTKAPDPKCYQTQWLHKTDLSD